MWRPWGASPKLGGQKKLPPKSCLRPHWLLPLFLHVFLCPWATPSLLPDWPSSLCCSKTRLAPCNSGRQKPGLSTCVCAWDLNILPGGWIKHLWIPCKCPFFFLTLDFTSSYSGCNTAEQLHMIFVDHEGRALQLCWGCSQHIGAHTAVGTSMSFPCSHPAEALGTTKVSRWGVSCLPVVHRPQLLQQGNGKMCGHLKLNQSSSAHMDMLKQKP